MKRDRENIIRKKEDVLEDYQKQYDDLQRYWEATKHRPVNSDLIEDTELKINMLTIEYLLVELLEKKGE